MGSGGAVQWFKDWFNAPFRQPLDVPRLFLAIGLVLVMIIVWGRIIGHIHERG